MQDAKPNLFTRDDTFFGVCAGLGEDFGISPTILRVAFAALLFFNPPVALGAYALAGLAVLASRLIAPAPRSAQASAGAPAAETALTSDNDADAQMAVAA